MKASQCRGVRAYCFTISARNTLCAVVACTHVCGRLLLLARGLQEGIAALQTVLINSDQFGPKAPNIGLSLDFPPDRTPGPGHGESA